MVLGKGSFGKVSFNNRETALLRKGLHLDGNQLIQGLIGGEKGNWWAVRHQNLEEGHHYTGRRCGMHNGRETCTRALEQTAFLGAIAFLFSDDGIYNTFLFIRKLHTLFIIE